MNGLAKLLKALFPKLDWSSPEACFRSAAPAGMDINAMVAFINNVPVIIAQLAERQARIETNIQFLVDEIERAKHAGRNHGNSHAGSPRSIAAGAGGRS